MARHGPVRQVMARLGLSEARIKAGPGPARRGWARRGRAGPEQGKDQGKEFSTSKAKDFYMEKMKVFRGGIPTKIDVDRLVDRFGLPKEGQVITFEELQDALPDIEFKSNRWHTVIDAWKKHLEKKHNIILGSKRGEGKIALLPEGRIDLAKDKYSTGIKMTGRAALLAIKTDRERLTPESKRTADFLRNAGAQIRLVDATAAKELAYPDPVPQRRIEA